MKIRSAASLASVIVSASLVAQDQEGPAKWLADFEKRFPPVIKNATAIEAERLALALGVDWVPSDPSADHPTKDDVEEYRQAPLGSWLDSQIKASDDSIGPPPARLREFLDKRRAILSRLVTRLERDVPEWGYDIRASGKPRPELVPVSVLNRILLSAALVEERAGSHVEAGEFLEGSWSLYRSLVWRPDLLSRLLAIGLAKNQIGALRKLSEPPFVWLRRMSEEEPEEFLEVLRDDSLVMRSSGFASSEPLLFDAWARGARAVFENLRVLSSCQVSRLSADEIWLPMAKELRESAEPGTDPDQAAEVFKGIATPNLIGALQRNARLLIDRELTAKILELRQEKAASRENRWPARFLDTSSTVCPEAHYEYATRGTTMAIRFKGSIEDPGSPALVLPLSFEAKAPIATPTPTRTPRPVASPNPGS